MTNKKVQSIVFLALIMVDIFIGYSFYGTGKLIADIGSYFAIAGAGFIVGILAAMWS